ncbi:glycosyltransferase family 2 protein [Acinetobacter sp. NigerLNRRAM0016]
MLISVVLPAYNAELYIKEAIDSVLAQTFTNFELIILNDGSSDKTEEIILSFQDSRIVYVKNEQNLGLIDTLNKGMALAKGKYIARMDADDICLPERFAKQINFLEENPDYMICGTSAYRFFNNLTNKRAFYVPISDGNIRVRLFFNTGFIHPSVMFRTETIRIHNLSFSREYKYAEDYYFWMDILQYGKGFNLKEKLLYYRVVETSQTAVGNANIDMRKQTLGNIHKRYFEEYGICFGEKEIDLNFYLSNIERMKSLDINIFDYKFINIFFKKIICVLKEGGVNHNIIYKEVGRVYFSLFYTRGLIDFKDKVFWVNFDFKLFLSGGFEFLKERFLK